MQHVQEWNNVRQDCVEVAIKKMLMPDLIKELHSNLLDEAKECILRACARKLYNWIKVF
jgi:transcription elongation factor SPT6